MALPYSLRQLINRVQRHINDEFPSSDFSVSVNEMQLYIEEALATTLIGNVYNGAKVEGNIAVPEGVVTTYSLPAMAQNTVTREWYSTLPQPPVSLPLGYSVSDGYFADSVNGKGLPITFVKTKRVAYRQYMPQPQGVLARIEGSRIICQVSDGSSLLNQTLYVTMASTRVSDIDAVLNVPDDFIEMMLTKVTARLMQRKQVPKDIIQDDISSGNKSS